MELVFVVQYYDTVEYAGTDPHKALSKVKGASCIQIWQEGKLKDWMKYKEFKEKFT